MVAGFSKPSLNLFSRFGIVVAGNPKPALNLFSRFGTAVAGYPITWFRLQDVLWDTVSEKGFLVLLV